MLRKVKRAPEGLDYIIVLGAHVRGKRLSKALLERTVKALEYLRENPGTKAVLSGGQGEGEEISEAEAMRRFLVKEGIDSSRLLLENRSTNTKENLVYSLAIIGDMSCSVGVVTNHYHVFRGVAIGRKAGCRNIYGIAAPYRTRRLLWYIPREILAIIKDKLLGNL